MQNLKSEVHKTDKSSQDGQKFTKWEKVHLTSLKGKFKPLHRTFKRIDYHIYLYKSDHDMKENVE